MFKIKTVCGNTAASGGGKRGGSSVSNMGRSTPDRVFKNPSAGSKVSKMGRSVPGSKKG